MAADAVFLPFERYHLPDFMKRHNIPTAEYQTFSAQNGGLEAALKYIDSVPFDVVVKASGLAAGKGVVVPETPEEAKAAVRECLEAKKFGDAGRGHGSKE
ncbi:ADE1 [Symbiodinium natans]|uniref:ADE1 protein n=1 Tax=Symbiodinium natans TaxID=878477 RepID=A0A812H6A3_9DINO|nr:ADE1 [Symbiodinium natans]